MHETEVTALLCPWSCRPLHSVPLQAGETLEEGLPDPQGSDGLADRAPCAVGGGSRVDRRGHALSEGLCARRGQQVRKGGLLTQLLSPG